MRCLGLASLCSLLHLVAVWGGLTGKLTLKRLVEPTSTVSPAAAGHDSPTTPTPEPTLASKASSEGHDRPKDKKGLKIKASEASRDACSKFEEVSFPLDGWPSSVRNAAGRSVYGTGWAQRLLREHQFPKSCEGKSFVEHGMFRSGMGSNMHVSASVLAFALNQQSIYLWPEDDMHNPWTRGPTRNSTAACPDGRPYRNYECYLKPISSCKPDGRGPRFTGVKRQRGNKTIKGLGLVPKVFTELLTPDDLTCNYILIQSHYISNLKPQKATEDVLQVPDEVLAQVVEGPSCGLPTATERRHRSGAGRVPRGSPSGQGPGSLGVLRAPRQLGTGLESPQSC